jgi:hypothetical protein
MLDKILFCPLDIELDNIEFSVVEGTPVISKYNPYWNSTLISDETIKKNNFDKVIKQLPFDKITNLQYKIQQKTVHSHVDVYPAMQFDQGEYQHILDNEPAGYRFIVRGAVDSLELFDGRSWITTSVPSIPCAYVLNSTSGIHRVKKDEGRTTIYIRGWLNRKQHLELLEKSIEKYGDYAVWKN